MSGILPAMLRIGDRLAVLVGGGAVARRRATALREAGARLRVVAPRIEPSLAAEAEETRERGYEEGDLSGAFVVVACTDDGDVNERVAAEARRLGALLNRADAPEQGDFEVPAHTSEGPLRLAVHTDGVSARAAARIRDACWAALDPEWPRLLAVAAAYRPIIQRRFADETQRRRRLTALVGTEAWRVLRTEGTEGLHAFCERVSDPEALPPEHD